MNPSFEQADSAGHTTGWQTLSGKMKRHTIKLFDAFPFSPSDASYYISIENDTLSAPRKAGIIQNQFAFSDTPYSFNFDGFYIPVTQPQNARFTLLFTKWNGTMRDTVLYKTDTIGPRFSSPGQIPLQWTTYRYNLKESYQKNELPDTATVIFVNDDLVTTTGTAVLHLDNIFWSPFSVGLRRTEPADLFMVYPNPSATFFTLHSAHQIASAEVFDGKGKKHKVISTQQENTLTIDCSDWDHGIYFLNIQSKSGSRKTIKLIVSN